MSDSKEQPLFREEIDETIRRIELAKVSTKAMEEGKKLGVPHNIKKCIKMLEENEQIIKDKTTVIQQQSRTIQSQINELVFKNLVITTKEDRIRYQANLLQDERDYYMLDIRALKRELEHKNDFILSLQKEKEKYLSLLTQRDKRILAFSKKKRVRNSSL